MKSKQRPDWWFAIRTFGPIVAAFVIGLAVLCLVYMVESVDWDWLWLTD